MNSPDRSFTLYRNLKIDGGDRTTGEVAALVLGIALQAELPQQKKYWLRLAAEEIATNIIQHGYEGPGPIWLAGDISAGEVRLLIEDEAPAFDPLKHDRRARLAVAPAEREQGGFGLLLALHRLDGFSYEYVDRRNRNTLIMSRTPPDSAT